MITHSHSLSSVGAGTSGFGSWYKNIAGGFVLKIGSVKMKMKYIFEIQLVGLWCLTPLSSNFSYIVADSFIAVPGKPRYPEKTCHLLQVTDKLYHLMFYRVPYDHDHDGPFFEIRVCQNCRSFNRGPYNKIKRMQPWPTFGILDRPFGFLC